jgi:photosystem II stability/assembly factor-like uncharacterized protein
MRARFIFASLVIILLVGFSFTPAIAQKSAASTPISNSPGAGAVDPSLYSAMRWRLLGPHRAGRVSAVAGIAGDPSTYYMGTPGGGVWKTGDGGQVWKPIFDAERVASIGAVAVAPSNPSIVYVGTGEQTPGNGMYKSTDAGASWIHIGLADVHYINSIIVDPGNPDIILVGALGHPILGTAPASPARGVFKSTDGGTSWTKTLYRDDFSGVADMVADPGDPRVLYAAVWHPREFRDGFEGATSPDGWIYKSVDEGSSWKQVGGQGLPSEPLDRSGLAVAPGDHGRRVFAITGQGLFRSDDAGESWRKITADPRIEGNLYFSRVFVDPRNADVVYVMQTTTYRSTDGGEHFDAFKGAPGGDDYHILWIDPQNSRRMILGVDQGATISVDGGKTWSSWFNQATGQFYHVITDEQFPYVAYAAQQDSGTAAVPNRSDFGEITYREWYSIGGFEFCFIAPDPLNPNIVYSGGWYGSVVRFDKTTGQIAHVFVRTDKYRTAQMAPILFSPLDPHSLYFGTQYVMKTTNGGESWQTISPDLSKRADAVPAGNRANPGGHTLEADAEDDMAFDADDDEKDEALKGEQSARGRAAIAAMALSPIAAGTIWAGTGNGIIEVTQDGGLNWRNVSPPELKDESTVENIEASHFDANSAYVTILERHDDTPYIYRTRDAGKSWQKITNGLKAGWLARVVREDPVRKGLLYAGTANEVYVSFDDGDRWQSLQLNLPVSDMRDLVVHGNDLVVATYGRALWALDDISPLRQAATSIAASSAYLLRPSAAVRVRWDNDQETPLPPEFPAASNPPDGAMFYYYLKSAPAQPIALEIRDARDNLIKRFSSQTPAPDTVIKNVPDYWFGPLTQIAANAGLNRFVWDLHYDPPPALQYSYYGNALDYLEYTLSDHAIAGETPREQTLGPLAVPGEYTATLVIGDQRSEQPFTITVDPRVHASLADLTLQFESALRIGAGLKSSYDAFNDAIAFRKNVADRAETLDASLKDRPETKEAAEAVKELEVQIEIILTGTTKDPGIGPINRDLARINFMVETGDAAPSESALGAIGDSCSGLTKKITDWHELQTEKLPAVNALLRKYNFAPIPAAAPATAGSRAAQAVSPGSGHVPIAASGIDRNQSSSTQPSSDACKP